MARLPQKSNSFGVRIPLFHDATAKITKTLTLLCTTTYVIDILLYVFWFQSFLSLDYSRKTLIGWIANFSSTSSDLNCSFRCYRFCGQFEDLSPDSSELVLLVLIQPMHLTSYNEVCKKLFDITLMHSS